MAAVLDDKTLRIVRVFNAPRERVFDAWVVEDNFIQWMCPPNVHVDEVKLDARPGGAWHLRGRNASRNFVTSGKYVEIKRPERLVFTWAHHETDRSRQPARPRDDGAPRIPCAGRQDRAHADPRTVRRYAELRQPSRGLDRLVRQARDLPAEASMTMHRVVSEAEWLEARRAHLAKEKEFTQLRDELARERRELPWMKVEKDYVFDAPEGRVDARRSVRRQGPAHRPALHVRPRLERGLPELLVLDRQLQRHRRASRPSRHGVRPGVARADRQARGLSQAHGLEPALGVVAPQRFQLRLRRVVRAGGEGEEVQLRHPGAVRPGERPASAPSGATRTARSIAPTRPMPAGSTC